MKAKVQPRTEPYPLCNKSCGIFCVLVLDTLYLVLRRAPNPVGSFATCVSEEKSPKAISPACAMCNCASLLQGILIRILIGLVTMSSFFSSDHLVPCVNIIWKFALIKLPEKHFRRNRIAIEFFMGVATDIHCSKTLYRLVESLLEKILMWQRCKKRLSDQPFDPSYTHFQGCNQDANLVGQNPDVKHPGGVRSVDGQE